MEELLKIERKPVDSSNIKAIGYSEELKTLTVEFYSGQTYAYSPVTQEGYLGLMKAESLGKHFYKYIRNNDSINCRSLD